MEKNLLDDLVNPGSPVFWIALVLTGGLSLVLWVLDLLFGVF
jgi:hypothetical protein